MAPKLMSSLSLETSDTDIIRYKKFNKKIKEYQNFIKKILSMLEKICLRGKINSL